RQRHRYFFRRREAVFAIKNHRVRAVEHKHRRARRLILALMNLQVGVLDVERQGKPFALNGAGKRGRDIEVERVAEFVSLGSPAGFNSSGQIARVVASKAGFAERAEQITQRLEAKKV